MSEHMQVEDDSGDRKYFTMAPNYILNHSTAIDQSLYMQMKRFAGEKGQCYASKRLLLEKMGIGYKALNKSIEYLLKREWITAIGEKEVMTKGGMQTITVYKVNDIWKLNNNFYEGASKSAPLYDKGAAERTEEVLSKAQTGAAESAQKKNQYKEPEEEDVPKGTEKPDKRNKDVQEIIDFLTELLEGIPLDGTQRETRQYAYLLLQKIRKVCREKNTPEDQAVPLIKGILTSATKGWHKKNATSFKYIYYNMGKIIQDSKSKSLIVAKV